MTKAKIIMFAKNIVEKKINPLEGCRQLVRLVHDLPEEEMNTPDILVLIGIDSELDGYPLGKGRELWNKEVLAKLDVEIEDYWKKFEPDLMKACKAIIKKFSND